MSAPCIELDTAPDVVFVSDPARGDVLGPPFTITIWVSQDIDDHRQGAAAETIFTSASVSGQAWYVSTCLHVKLCTLAASKSNTAV
jgi:hypothetical protein